LPLAGIRHTLKPIVERFGILIFNVAWALIGEADSADRIACEAFARIYQSGLDNGNQNVSGLRAVLLRHVVQMSGREAFRKRLAEVLGGCFGLRPTKAGGVDGQSTSTFANPAVERLKRVSFRLRAPLVLREVAELPISAVAQVLSVSEREVRRRLLKGRQALLDVPPKEATGT
jgi:DNA-directed RNA polymerase specialized sigma24 family protein